MGLSNIYQKQSYLIAILNKMKGGIILPSSKLSVEDMSDAALDYIKSFIDEDETASFFINAIYPVGSIYMSVNNVDPSILFGGGWEQISGKFLLAASDEYEVGSEGGESSHSLTVQEMPTHSHIATTGSGGTHTHTIGTARNSKTFSGNVYSVHPDATGAETFNGTTSQDGSHEHTVRVENTGNGLAHNNMPPYLTVNMWKRVS